MCMKYFIETRKLPHPFYYFRSCKFSSFILNGMKGVFMRGLQRNESLILDEKGREEEMDGT